MSNRVAKQGSSDDEKPVRITEANFSSQLCGSIETDENVKKRIRDCFLMRHVVLAIVGVAIFLLGILTCYFLLTRYQSFTLEQIVADIVHENLGIHLTPLSDTE